MKSNTKKKPLINVQNRYKNEAKRVIAITFTIKKVERARTISGAIEKSSILLLKYWKI